MPKRCEKFGKVSRPVIEGLEERRLLASVALGFGGGSGGIADTGFTTTLPGSGTVSSNLRLSNGQLLVATTAGDLTRNNQANALALGVNATTNFTVQSRLRGLNFKANWQNGGIVVGTNQDNYVKFVVGYSGGTMLQLGSESNAAFTSVKQTALNFSGITTLDLRLVGTASSKTVVAQYRVNSDSDSAWVTYGQVTNANVFSTAARAGIVSTNLGTSSTVVDYDSFSVTDGSTTPPPTPPPAGTLTVGANVNATRMGGNQVETEIAVNPRNANNLVIVGTSSNNGGSQLVISRSFDGGRTWATSSLGSAQDKLSGSTPRVDPHVTFDRFGNAYVVYMVAASTSEIRVIVARSSDGGANWTASTAVAGQGTGIDFPIIGTGPDATDLNRETVWVGYTDTRNRRVKVVAARSTGLGNLGGFSGPATVSDAAGSYGSIAVGPAGQVVMAWQTNTGGQGPSKIMLDVDADGLGTGKTWGVDKYVADTNVGGFDYIPAQPNRSIDANVGLAFDRSTNSSTRGRLYLVYTDENGNESNNTDIILRYSDNLGTGWSSKLKVNNDSTTRSQFLPAMAVDQSNGNVAIVWRDARNSSGNNTAELWGTVSINHGASVRPNVKISAGTSNQAGANGAGTDYDFGDYQGVAFANGKFTAVWADNSNSTRDNPNGTTLFDLYTAGVTVS